MPTSKQRRAAEQRRLRRQASRRQQQAARRRQLNIILSVVGTLLIFGIVITLITVTNGSDSTPTAKASTAKTSTAKTSAAKTSAAQTSAATSAKTSPTKSATTSTAPTPATSTANSPTARASSVAAPVTTTCSYPRSGKAARTVRTPSTKARSQGTVLIRLATSQGAMTFTLDRTAAPCAVNSFVSLARQKYYDNTSCHRLVTKSIFLLQCGDPTGTGTGGPGYRFADELGTNPVFRRGTVVMANGGPNTNGSQFFIIDRDTRLGAAYTPLGTVTSGLSVADKVYRAGTSDGSSDGPPKLRLTFRTVTVA